LSDRKQSKEIAGDQNIPNKNGLTTDEPTISDDQRSATRRKTMIATTIESAANRAPRSAMKGSATWWFLQRASLATACMGLAAAAMAQAPSARLATAAGVEARAAHGAASPAQCPSREILAGVNDNFSTANGVEATSPSLKLKSVLAGAHLADFDTTVPNMGIAHTFQLPRCGAIVGAKLEFRAKPLPDNPSNDAIDLGFSTLPGFPRWSAWFGGGNAPTSPSLQVPVWGSTTAAKIFTLDLAALPTVGSTISLLSAVQTNRYLDFYVEDDTSIDYVKLTYTLCDCSPCGKAEQGEAKD
jgi:hypothetical protein